MTVTEVGKAIRPPRRSPDGLRREAQNETGVFRTTSRLPDRERHGRAKQDSIKSFISRHLIYRLLPQRRVNGSPGAVTKHPLRPATQDGFIEIGFYQLAFPRGACELLCEGVLGSMTT